MDTVNLKYSNINIKLIVSSTNQLLTIGKEYFYKSYKFIGWWISANVTIISSRKIKLFIEIQASLACQPQYRNQLNIHSRSANWEMHGWCSHGAPRAASPLLIPPPPLSRAATLHPRLYCRRLMCLHILITPNCSSYYSDHCNQP